MKKILSSFLIVAILVLAMPSKAFAAFSFYRSITVNGSQVPTTQTNFPMLVSGTYSYLATVANGGKVQNANGYDVGFYSNSNCSTGKLNWETEKYTATTGEVVYWVNIASISNGSVIYMCYGDASISTDQSASTATWNSSFKAVYHLPNGSSLTANDSTSNGNNGTLTNTPTAITGQMDGGAATNGSSSYIKSASALTSANFTLSGWFKTLETSNYHLYFGQGTQRGGGGTDYVVFGQDAVGNINYSQASFSGSGPVELTGPAIDTNWHLFTATYDGTTFSFYMDGVLKNSTTPSGTHVTINSGVPQIGAGQSPALSATEYTNGQADEIRAADTSRSADWITAEYNNQSAPASFYTVGAEQGGGGVTTSYYSKWQFSKTIFVFNKVNWVFR